MTGMSCTTRILLIFVLLLSAPSVNGSDAPAFPLRSPLSSFLPGEQSTLSGSSPKRGKKEVQKPLSAWDFSLLILVQGQGRVVEGAVAKNSSPNDELLNFRDDLGFPDLVLMTGLGLDLKIRKNGGLFLRSSWLRAKGTSLAGPDGLAYDGLDFPSLCSISSAWEGLFFSGGLFYCIVPEQTNRIHAEAGLTCLSSRFEIRLNGTPQLSAEETLDVILPTLGFRGLFLLFPGLSFTTRVTLGYISYGGTKSNQENMLLDARLGLSIAWSRDITLTFTFDYLHFLAFREDRGIREELSLTPFGLGLTLRFDLF